MRAARFYGYRDIRIEEIPEPECSSGQVKIAPRFNGLCGSDLHLFFDKPMTAQFANPHPITGETLPVTFGHEFSGIVTEVGDGVSQIAIGDKVAVHPVIHDGVCSTCVRGAINCCPKLGFRGVHGFGGGLSDAIVVPEASVFKLPDGIDCDIGALIEPLAVGWHGVRVAGEVSASSAALVQGSGPIGCAVILALRAKGVKNIIATEVSAVRRRFALEFGASVAIDPQETDVVEIVHNNTEGEGVDVVFDCAGVPQTVTTGVDALRPLGTFVNLALWLQPSPLNAMAMVVKEGTYKGALAYTLQDFAEVIAAIGNGSLNAKNMITKRIALDDIVKEGLEQLHNGDQHCKILVDLTL